MNKTPKRKTKKNTTEETSVYTLKEGEALLDQANYLIYSALESKNKKKLIILITALEAEKQRLENLHERAERWKAITQYDLEKLRNSKILRPIKFKEEQTTKEDDRI